MKIWALTNEMPHYEPDTQSLCGLFSSREKALRHLADEQIGEEHAARIQWQQSEYTSDFWEGHAFDENGELVYSYLLTAWAVDKA